MSEATQKLREALRLLDPARDDDWTGAGLPAMVAVRRLVDDAEVTRAQVEEAYPGFTRDFAASDAAVSDLVAEDEATDPDALTSPETPLVMDRGEGRPPAPPEDLGAGTSAAATATARLDRLRAELAKTEAQAVAARARVLELERDVGEAEQALEALVPKISPAEEIRRVLQRSQESRARRAEVATDAAGRRSPIDRAYMSTRRINRSRRPSFPKAQG